MALRRHYVVSAIGEDTLRYMLPRCDDRCHIRYDRLEYVLMLSRRRDITLMPLIRYGAAAMPPMPPALLRHTVAYYAMLCCRVTLMMLLLILRHYYDARAFDDADATILPVVTPLLPPLIRRQYAITGCAITNIT